MCCDLLLFEWFFDVFFEVVKADVVVEEVDGV